MAGLIFLWVSFVAAATASYAGMKNRSMLAWGVLGALMPIVAFVLVVTQPALPAPAVQAAAPQPESAA